MDAAQIERIAITMEGLDRSPVAPQDRKSYIREAERFVVAFAALQPPAPLPAAAPQVGLRRPTTRLLGVG